MDRSLFRLKAQRCRELLRAAKAPGVREQLLLWIKEFEQAAASAVKTRRHSPLSFRAGSYAERVGDAAD
ncbi:MAG: hypothetical protein JO001_25515 [Alphaproteobacteria bacterium]|nr:hypothetical protein [Alphaproteobacteria bacterium]